MKFTIFCSPRMRIPLYVRSNHHWPSEIDLNCSRMRSFSTWWKNLSRKEAYRNYALPSRNSSTTSTLDPYLPRYGSYLRLLRGPSSLTPLITSPLESIGLELSVPTANSPPPCHLQRNPRSRSRASHRKTRKRQRNAPGHRRSARTDNFVRGGTRRSRRIC